MTTKSQVTIPKAVRDIFRLEKGDLVVFVREKRKILVKKGRLMAEA